MTPDVISFNVAVLACRKGGQWDGALSLFGRMCVEGMQPDVISFNVAVSVWEGRRWVASFPCSARCV